MSTHKYVYKKGEHIYKTPELCEALHVSRMTIYTWEQKGIFSPPRNMRGDRVFTESQFRDVIKELSPGGKGTWTFVPEE